MAAKRRKKAATDPGPPKEQKPDSTKHERMHASPPTVLFDGSTGKQPSAVDIPWRMWPRRSAPGRPHEPEIFWHQSWYGARRLAAMHFGVSRDQIMWDENYGKTE